MSGGVMLGDAARHRKDFRIPLQGADQGAAGVARLPPVGTGRQDFWLQTAEKRITVSRYGEWSRPRKAIFPWGVESSKEVDQAVVP